MATQSISAFHLSAQQERLWSQQAGAADPFVSVCEVLLAGRLDVDRLRTALQAVVARHEILRTVFHRQAGVKIPFQVIADKLDADWRVEDLSDVEASERAGALDELWRSSRASFQ